jgi:methionyl-tRNA synthetase
MAQKALEEIFALISAANKYIDANAPWKLFKDGNTSTLGAVMFNLLEVLRFVGVLLKPFLPETADKIFTKLGVKNKKIKNFSSLKTFGLIATDKITKGEAIFVRLNIADELNALEEISKAAKKPPRPQAGTPPSEGNQRQTVLTGTELPEGVIGIDDFMKVKLRVGRVTACEKVEKSEKLLKLTVADGEGSTRVIVSGIAKYYLPEDMAGKEVVFVQNLKPVKLCGVESHGMILCAAEGDSLCIVRPEKTMPAGTEVR